MTLVTSDDRPAPGTIIGWLRNGTRPVYVQAGGSGDDDDDDDTGIDLEAGGGSGSGSGADDDADDEEETDDDAEEAKPAPAKPKPADKQYTKTDIDKLTGALDKERAASKAARAQIRELSTQLKAATKKPTTDEAEAALETAREEAAAAAEQKLKPVVVNAAAKAGLLAAGLTATGEATMKRLLRTLDLADIDIDDDGEVTGLDEQIEGIKEAFPELFKKDEPAPVTKVRAPRLDAAGKTNTQPTPKTTGEIYAQRIIGGHSRG